ncbi:DNA polymerase III subunit epsilon [Catenovulum maritimum]|uniref:DNA polymerase III subunit epsilon n=1 Tax=Catenovulum maritimum TaxID=1513271 RepID=A0A0J8JHJ8_9ALTE|nr:DNA polymerase III subunit epsilon [Catenovulum maritimum]KMT63906.1 DNA polymerase III subunit epsilon [Catenovulum maritimum]
MARQIVLDTETTGMNQAGGPVYLGHRIIEIGCVEIVNRRLTGNHYHVYIKPDREVDPEAFEVHGISDEMLADKPDFTVIAEEFIEFIRGAELVIHNAPFDVGFMDYEFEKMGLNVKTEDICKITDSLSLAKKMFPGKRNNLDVLCNRFGIDNSHRTLHGALLDSEILADVYLLMTGGQTALNLASDSNDDGSITDIIRVSSDRKPLKIVSATADEIDEHNKRLDLVEKSAGSSLWRSE